MNACQGAESEWILWYCPFLSQQERMFTNHMYIAKKSECCRCSSRLVWHTCSKAVKGTSFQFHSKTLGLPTAF